MRKKRWVPGLLAGIIIVNNVSAANAQVVAPQRPNVPLEFPAPQYDQEIIIEFATPQAAAGALVTITPLWDGREWAVSSRWDDNTPNNIPMSDFLAEHGQSGTFYLNGLYADWSVGTPVLDSKYGRDLIAKGASIGCHSLTHPLLAVCSRSRMFEEVIGDRMQWEAAVDQPVMSYAFSYSNFTSPEEGLVVHADIARLLERSGFYNVANEPSFENIDTELTLSPIMPGDGGDIDNYVQTVTGSAEFKSAHPNLTYSMHSWYYATPQAWAKLDGQFDKYGHRVDWWYCNQNQYGAYRYQHQRTKLSAVAIVGNTMKLRLERPMLLDLGDEIPLTLEVTGVKAAEISSVKCATADCKLSDRSPSLFHIHHDRSQALPKKIGMVPINYSNRHTPGANDYDSDFPDLGALLHFEDGQLKVIIENRSVKPLSHVRLTYRLPLMWKEGVVWHELADLPAGTSAADSIEPTQVQQDLRYTMGRGFFAVQMDFVLEGQPGRLHLGCITAPSDQTDPSYPCDGFVLLGPIPQAQLNPDEFAKNALDGRVDLTDLITQDGTRYSWRNDEASRQPQLDAELIPLTSSYLPAPGWCVVASTVQSSKAQKLDLQFYNGFTRAFLNGREVKGYSTVELKAGANELLILTVEWGGFYLRLATPGTQERARDIRYERPALPGNDNVRLPPAITQFDPPSASALSTVTITGQNFLGATSVRFGGVQAEFTPVSPTPSTILTATVPPSATNGPITVVTPAGTATTADSFYVGLFSNLTLAVSSFPNSVSLGDSLHYTIYITNRGPLDAADVVLTDRLPAGTKLIFAPTEAECGESNNIITCHLGTLAAGADVAINVTVTITDGPYLTNKVNVVSQTPDPDLSNNAASILTILKGSPPPPPPNVALGTSLAVNVLELSWPATANGFVLERTPNLTPPVKWSTVNQAPANVQGRRTVNQDISSGSGFYRLRKP